MKHILTAALMAGSILLMGCSEEDFPADRSPSDLLQPEKRESAYLRAGESDLMIPIAVSEEIVKRDKEMRRDGRKQELREQRMAVVQLMKLFKKLEKESDWQAVDRVLRGQLATYERHPLSFAFEQLIGNLMLRKKLLVGELTDAKRETIAYYAELLIRNNHEDASIILPALRALQQTWPRERVIQAIDVSIQNAERWVNKTTGCADCPPENQLNEEVVARLKGPKAARVLSVIDAMNGLRELGAELNHR